MLVTNQTSQDYWFGPLHLAAGINQTLTVDDTTATSLYLTDDQVADAINNLLAAGKITVGSAAAPFPRPTGTPELLHGDGSPEGHSFAPQGSVYMRRDLAGLYVKTTASTLDTGWAPNAGTELDFKQATADITGINATTEATATAVITGNSVSYDGYRVKLEFFAPEIVNVGGTGTNKVTLVFLRDTTVIGQAVILETGSTFMNGVGPKAECFDTPAAGAHTYAVKAFAAATSPNYTVKAGTGVSGTLVAAFLRVTKA
ncbi:MAG: hypothetical protein ACJ768_00035 [Gaiellaceae bacterium]